MQRYCYSTYFQFTVAHALGSQPSLAISWQWICQSQLIHEVFLAQSNSFLAISSQSPWTAISRTWTNSLLTTVLYSIYSPSTVVYPVYFASTSTESESDVTTDSQLASLSWYKAPIRGLRPDFYFRSEYGIRLTVMFLILWGALSDERTGLSFVCAAGRCQCSLSRVLVPWDLRPYFTVSDLRLPFSSPPTTRRVTVEIFDPASRRVLSLTELSWTELSFCNSEANQIEITTSNSSSVTASIRCSWNVFTEPLSSNGLFRLSGTTSHSSRIRVLVSHCLAMDYSGFQIPRHTRHGYAF
jgi:hypothetical protein